MLADLQAWHGSGNRLELSADFRRRIRLQIEGVDMAGTAIVENQNARLDGTRGYYRHSSPGLCLPQSAQAESQGTAEPKLEQAATSQYICIADHVPIVTAPVVT